MSSRSSRFRGRRSEDPAGPSVMGHVDAPASASVVLPGPVAVRGWTVHRRQPVEAVALRVDGAFAAIAPVTGSRPDVAVAHPHAPHAETSGWGVQLDLADHAGTTVVVEAHALVAVGPDAVGRWILFATLQLDVALGEHAERAAFEGSSLRSGAVTVHGLAESPDGISRVDVACDGVPVGAARVLLPGRFPDRSGPAGPLSGLSRFECDLDVPPGSDRVELTARVVTEQGRSFEARAWSAPVLAAPAAPERGGRLDRVMALTDDLARRAAGAATLPAGSPRVLVVTHDLGLGGGQLYLHDLVLGLLERGVACAVTSMVGGELVPALEELGVPVSITGAFDPTDPEQYEALVRHVMVFGAAHACEVALANTLPAFGAVDAAQRLGLDVVWALHESFDLDHFWNHAYAAPVAEHIRHRAVTALSRTRRAVFEATPTADLYASLVPAGASAVVPYGVPVEQIDAYLAHHDRHAVRASLGFDHATVVMVCVAMIEPRKAQANLAAALAGSDRLRGRDVALVLVGARPHSPYAEEIAAAVAAWGEERIRIEPVQPDTYQWYHAADVLVSGSDIESLPRSMLEAMAFGRPIASTAVFGVPELVTDGDTGFLCGSRDVRAMRAMLERVVDTPRVELAAMGERARTTVRRRHDPAIYIDHYHRALTEAARTGGHQ